MAVPRHHNVIEYVGHLPESVDERDDLEGPLNRQTAVGLAEVILHINDDESCFCIGFHLIVRNKK